MERFCSKKGKEKKMGVWKDLKIGLIRFVFCLLFKAHDQSDISPICVSSRGGDWRTLPINLPRFRVLYIRHRNQNKKIMKNEKVLIRN